MLFKLKLINKIPRILKQFFFIVCDICICIISVWLALFLRLDQFLPISGNILWAAVISALILITTFYFFGLYKTIFRYSGKAEMLSIFFGVIIYGIFYTTIITILVIDGVPRSVGIIQPLILFFLLSGSRFILRLIIDDNLYNYYFYKKKNAMIYGAGDAGRQLLSALENNREFKVKGFIDDNKKLHNKFMNGIPIFLPNNIDRLIKNKKISHFLIAIPSASRNRRREILTKLKNYNVDVRILPSLTDLVEGKVTVADIKYPELEDLLEREQVKPDSELLKKNIENKTVLVTGAGGSIGSELCRQIIKFNPLKLIMLDINEHNLYKIHSELDQIFKKKNIIISNQDTQLIPIISSILDERRIEHVFSFFKPHTIYHTAAYKHVPLVEENIAVGVKNNVIGTINLAKIAIKYSVFNFVFISSDKAVRPTNVMGASKRLSEISLRSIFHNQNLTNKLSIVRFGNVLGSSGSLIPKVKEQIKLGGPITLTHRDVTRFFMTIQEAAQLVIQAGAMDSDSNIFILDMGKPIKILDLITKLVSLSGLKIIDEKNSSGDIRIEIIGLRPGEKLHEELLLSDNAQSTSHKKIMKSNDNVVPWIQLQKSIKKLDQLINDNAVDEIKKILKYIVSDYEIYDQTVDKLKTSKIE